MMDQLTLFTLHPDALHLFLGTGNNLVEALFMEAKAYKEAGEESYMDKFVQQPGQGVRGEE